MKKKIVIRRKIGHIFSVYAQVQRMAFWDVTEVGVVAVSESEPLLVAGNLNGSTGVDREVLKI